MTGDIEVVYVPELPRWAVRIQGEGVQLSLHTDKADAEKRGGREAQRRGVELIVKNKNGRVAKRDSHGGDRRDRKG